jgi:hypothetical protein
MLALEYGWKFLFYWTIIDFLCSDSLNLGTVSKRGILSTANWKKANSPTFSAAKISRFTVYDKIEYILQTVTKWKNDATIPKMESLRRHTEWIINVPRIFLFFTGHSW